MEIDVRNAQLPGLEFDADYRPDAEELGKAGQRGSLSTWDGVAGG